jgi:CBS domain-containing protein
MNCPACAYENIPGVDVCEDCGQPLSGLHEPGSDLERSIIRHPIGVLVSRRPVTVSGDTPVQVAIDAMLQHGIGCVLVEAEGRIAGIFTERDVLMKVALDRAQLQQPVSQLMTPAPVMVTPDDSIAYAMQQMCVGGHRHLPVARAGQSASGVISARDLVRFLAVRFAEIRS